jgi:Kef-type K+ transport system membrane component KefB
MENIFMQLAFILTISSILGFLTLKLHLPTIVSYLLAGVTLSFLPLFDTTQSMVFHIFPHIGIAFVLFLIGMELDLRELKALGKPIVISSFGQVIVSTILGYFLATFLGFRQLESFYLAIGLSFSSTVVVIKMLLEKKDISSLYGKLSIGILLVEDLIAIIALMFISVSGSALKLGFTDFTPFILLAIKGAVLFLSTYIFAKLIAKRILDSVAKSPELLFLTAITWCFIFTAFAELLGLSVEIGAFLAGVALAATPYNFHIQGKVRPLRDFFLALFFIYIGSQVQFIDIRTGFIAILIFTLYALLIKPIIYLVSLGLFGFRKHTLFQTALNLSQISEFTLIVLLVGVNAGIVSASTLSIMASVTVLSITFSSILVLHSRTIYSFISPMVHLFVHKNSSHFLESSSTDTLVDHVVMVGAHRIATPILDFLRGEKIPFVVMDFNPHVIRRLKGEGINAIYGDVTDPEVIDALHIEKAKLIISTLSYKSDTEMLLHECKRRKAHATIIVRGEDTEHSKILKELGADYIVLPERISGIYLMNQIKKQWPTIDLSGLE